MADDDSSFKSGVAGGGSRGGTDQTCCLSDSGVRCARPAGCASYSKIIQKTMLQRRLKLVADSTVSHQYICDFHKNAIQQLRSQQKSRDSRGGGGVGVGGVGAGEHLEGSHASSQHAHGCEIDFFRQPVGLLRRYKRHYKLQTKQGINKAQLADLVAQHFSTQQVNEKEVLSQFLYICKNNKNRGGGGAAGAGDRSDSPN